MGQQRQIAKVRSQECGICVTSFSKRSAAAAGRLSAPGLVGFPPYYLSGLRSQTERLYIPVQISTLRYLMILCMFLLQSLM